jgi:hypothetical protein
MYTYIDKQIWKYYIREETETLFLSQQPVQN